MIKHWIIKKKKKIIATILFKWVHIHTQARPFTHALHFLYVIKKSELLVVQNTMIRLSLFMTLHCINQAGSGLAIIKK